MRAAGLVEGEAAQATGHPASPCAETALAREEVLSAVLLELWAFAGGADLATLRGRPRLQGVGDVELVEVLARLVEAGSIEVSAPRGVARYQLRSEERASLEARFSGEGTLEGAIDAHLAWCVSVVTAAEGCCAADGRPQGPQGHLCVEQANLEAALEVALDRGDLGSATALAVALCGLWAFRRPPRHALGALDRILQESLELGSRLELLAGRARLALGEGEVQTAVAELGAAVDLAGGAGDRGRQAILSRELGLALLCAGDVAVGRRIIGQSLVELDRLGAASELGRGAWAMALAEIAEGDEGAARSRLEGALRLQLAVGDEPGYGRSLLARSFALLVEGEREGAFEDASAAAEVFLHVEDEDDLADALLVAARALGRERLELSLAAAGAAASLAGEGFMARMPRWREALDGTLAPVRARAGGRGAGLPGEVEAADPAAVVRWLRVLATETSPLDMAEISLLGGFELRRGGLEVILAPQVARLVKILALTAEGLHVEQAIDRLWPEAAPQRGRRRLRNLLSRLSRVAGPVILRRADVLRLSPEVVVDAFRFESAANEAIVALRTGENRLEALARPVHSQVGEGLGPARRGPEDFGEVGPRHGKARAEREVGDERLTATGKRHSTESADATESERAEEVQLKSRGVRCSLLAHGHGGGRVQGGGPARSRGAGAHARTMRPDDLGCAPCPCTAAAPAGPVAQPGGSAAEPTAQRAFRSCAEACRPTAPWSPSSPSSSWGPPSTCGASLDVELMT